MRRLRGFGDTTFSLSGDGGGAEGGAPISEARFVLEVAGEAERPWRVQRFEHTEAVSRVFTCAIDVASERFSDNPDLLLGRAVTLRVQREPLVRRVHGLVSRVEHRGTTGSDRLARVTVVPSLWTLSQRSDARVFQDMSAVEVAVAVLRAAGLYAGAVTVALSRALPKREYCVQYRETDLEFFERLLASEGVSYLVEHTEGGEALRITDAFHDAPGVLTLDGGAVPVAGPESITAAVETVRNLTWVRALRPTQVTVRDHDFTRPTCPSRPSRRAVPRSTARSSSPLRR
jgi:type VI secretion system secreted protein VgrG